MTVPNLITTIRIILAPIFIIYLLHDQFLSALIVFAVSGVSDGVDGLVARVFDQKSKIGTYLDPLADKIILVSAFIVLAVRDVLPPWLAVLVISRDVLILFGFLALSLNRLEFNIKPSILSKITTCLQFITVIAVLSKDYFLFSSRFYFYVFIITALFTISSGLHYMQYWYKLMGEES
ncbi:MAG: CDP-alcohol phosphatidyltransferase family protein [Deltaproteobacteria bacterium]|nr:CDP-alcohol phosphatidyltransferase family protein [Deltaproteobacteria bacterium]